MADDKIAFIDTEYDPERKVVRDWGAVVADCPLFAPDGDKFHDTSKIRFTEFIKDARFICGHNIVCHDLKYFDLPEGVREKDIIDTLFLSPLFFPNKPYHKLVKDDLPLEGEPYNPLNDSIKCITLFLDEISAFSKLPFELKRILNTLLSDVPGYGGFFGYLDFNDKAVYPGREIRQLFFGKICDNCDLDALISEHPVELAYALMYIYKYDGESQIPPWVLYNYSAVSTVVKKLRLTPCDDGCPYCNRVFNLKERLREKFGYPDFRKYNDEPLQEEAVRAAVRNESLIAVFPTGGGKSLTFQLPALISGDQVKGLTVVISPLQSLMKDQVDNLNAKGVPDAAMINGMLDPIERAQVVHNVQEGLVSILYISPEALRSNTIERLLLKRNVVRFVIDEAHCFSSWGQDFRVDYLYIGDFIAEYQKKKKLTEQIPVSCFTATAKQKVISDICEYFMEKLGIKLNLFTTNAARTNLKYGVINREGDQEKYKTLRQLLDDKKDQASIVYVSRVRKTVKIAERLRKDGFAAAAYNGKMDSDVKIDIQDKFKNGEIKVIVATSAFGMGVDKDDVRLVVHYDISASLEDYVQEAGRAGRNEKLDAECYVLYSEKDLDEHFIMLNQTKLSIREIEQVWSAIKNLSLNQKFFSASAFDIAKNAGWQDQIADGAETKVKTAVNALEMAGYIKRYNNSPRVFANSIQVGSLVEASRIIDTSDLFTKEDAELAKRTMSSLIGKRSRKSTTKDEEGHIDYMADALGVSNEKEMVIVEKLRECGILADSNETYALIDKTVLNRSTADRTFNLVCNIEDSILSYLNSMQGDILDYKLINEAISADIKNCNLQRIRNTIRFWISQKYIAKPEGEVQRYIKIECLMSPKVMAERILLRHRLADFIEKYLIEKAKVSDDKEKDDPFIKVSFSPIEIKKAYDDTPNLFNDKIEVADVKEALLFLTKNGVIRIEGGFIVIYNRMSIERVEMNNRIHYKKEDYRKLEEHYRGKSQQIHIVGRYANMMVKDYDAALQFVDDYFHEDYEKFLKKYFVGDQREEIERNITSSLYNKLFVELTESQRRVIEDKETERIVVAAGPGSGKTKVLIHKLASLMMMENEKHEQLLMLTFSRAAAMEFKRRLVELIGPSAYYVEITTFHSYAFNLLGKIGSLEGSRNVVADATKLIASGEVELDRITKTVMVIDEAQDMSKEEYELVCAIADRNEGMRIIAVGDDDQNIYEFRESDSKWMGSFLEHDSSCLYQMTDNFRSIPQIVAAANVYAGNLENRMKTEPIISRREGEGKVTVIYSDSVLERVLYNRFKDNYRKNTRTAILTTTNEEAYRLLNLLKQDGYNARLIQSNDGFDIVNLDEIRYFLSLVGKEDVPVVEQNDWNEAVDSLKKVFSDSDNLKNVLVILDAYRKTNPNIIYLYDLINFVTECKFEDFYECGEGEILISTIHKAKGREFDDVFMLLSDKIKPNAARKRVIYVGMTRAKDNLFIATNGKSFEGIDSELAHAGVKFYKDRNVYEEAKEMTFSLGHKDIWLDFGNRLMLENYGEIKGGDELSVRVNKYNRLEFVAHINGREQVVTETSRSFYENTYLKWIQKGYKPKTAKVEYVVKWRGKDSEKDTKIVLPTICLEKVEESPAVKEEVEEVTKNEGLIGQRAKPPKKLRGKDNYPIEKLADFKFEREKSISQFLEQINSLSNGNHRGISHATITKWLIQEGYMVEAYNYNILKTQRIPTEKGSALGIKMSKRRDKKGNEFVLVTYDERAQKFIVDNMAKILGRED